MEKPSSGWFFIGGRRYKMDSCIRLACYRSCRGKVRCAHCGEWVCPNDVDEDGLCDHCEEVKESENEEE